MKTIVFANQKGGVAKTTSAMAVAEGLTECGLRVLLIDCDPQCNSTATHGAVTENATTLCDVLYNGDPILEAIQHTALGDIVPSDPLLSGADVRIIKLGKEYLLRDALVAVTDQYDYCIIDTPPSLGILLINALTAADSVIVPLTADAYSTDGLAALTSTIDDVKRFTNPNLQRPQLLLTKWSARTKLSRRFAEDLATLAVDIGADILPIRIRECVSVRTAQDQQRGLLKHASKSTVAEDYRQLAAYVKGDENHG